MVARLLVGTLVAVLVGAPAVHAAGAPLDPATLAGTWSGTWQNLKFGSTGTLSGTLAVPDANTITIVYSVTGNVFGCASVPPTTLTLVKGTDFSDKAVSFKRQDPVFGATTIKSRKKGQRLLGKGRGTCGGAGPKSWSFAAKLDGTTLLGKMKINLGKGTAKTNFSVSKQ